MSAARRIASSAAAKDIVQRLMSMTECAVRCSVKTATPQYQNVKMTTMIETYRRGFFKGIAASTQNMFNNH